MEEQKPKKKITRSKEHILAMNRGHIGRHRSQTAKDKISATLKGKSQPWVADRWAKMTKDEKSQAVIPAVEASFKTRKSTKIELIFEEILLSRNIRYEKQKRIDRYFVDFFLIDYNLVVEIYGCYPHQCSLCGFTNGAYGKDVSDILYNDYTRMQKIESLGYRTKIIWGHQLLKKKE